jgi:hypothetical protein
VWAARELFYADLFDSRGTGCSSAFGLPGQRDRHAGCVGAYLVEHDLFDFLLLSLPDNDSYSHRYGPYAQPRSIAEADRALERVMHAAGGIDAFLEDHALIVASDHSQSPVEDRINLAQALRSWRVLGPADADPRDAELAVCPGARSAMVYVLGDGGGSGAQRAAEDLQGVEGVDLVVSLEDGEAAVRSERGELRFSAGGDLYDGRGRPWSIEGEPRALDLSISDGQLSSRLYPDPLERVWSVLHCPYAGDVVVSAAPGYEFVDWGGADHVGGGSHGSLHRADSLGVLLLCGTGPADGERREGWSVTDVASLVLQHFSISSER